MTLPRAFDHVRASQLCRRLVMRKGSLRVDLERARTASPFAQEIGLLELSARHPLLIRAERPQTIAATLDARFDRTLLPARGSQFTLMKSTTLGVHTLFPNDQSS